MAGIAAFGTSLSLSDGASPEVYTAIAQLTSIGIPGFSRDIIDVSSHDDTSGWESIVTGMKRHSEFTIEGNFDPAGATHKDATGGLLDQFDDGDLGHYKLTFPDTGATEWTFYAYVTAFDGAAPHDDKLGFSATFKISGVPTLA